MAERLEITLLGGVAITRGGKPVTGLGTRKAEALLAYLVMQQRPFPRELLADLLWDDRPQDQALANLRSLLSGLRRRLGDYLIISRQTVAFNFDSDYWLDVAEFERLLKFEDSRLKEAHHQSSIVNHQEAVALYRGDFLAGFHIREAFRFEEWAVLERERLRQLAVTALRQLVNGALETNQIDQGLAYAATLTRLDPFSESARQQMMRLLVRDGRRNVALAHYEAFRQFLAAELEVVPLPETKALYERIKMADPTRHNLPTPPTPFIGRKAELAEIEERLADPDCRLLTITGPGGIGKTRLALQAAANQIGRLLNGVFFVSLAAVTVTTGDDPDELVTAAIVESVGLALQGTQTVASELIDYLRQKELLLVLDNFEHLLAAAPLLDNILHQAPDVTLLVTSRQRLNLQGEWLFDLHGLVRADHDRTNGEPSDAVRLFYQIAGRMDAGFDPATADLAAISCICYLVRGMPLAIELAASWMRLLSPHEIVAEIEGGLSFLAAPVRNLPQRHQSMQAVFDASWKLLTEAEQAVMRQLSLFRGRFTRQAAQAVAGVTLPTLLSLVDKSLVGKITDAAGTAVYFNLHELLRQYAAARLAQHPAEKATARERHGRYYAQFLHQQEKGVLSSQQKETLAAIGAEIDNIRAAWHWLTSQRRYDALNLALEGMYLFYWARGWLREGYTAFQEAIAAVQAAAAPDETLLARALWRYAEFCAWLGLFEEADAALAQSIAILRRVSYLDELAMALEANGRLRYWQGHFTAAKHLFEETLALFRQTGNAIGQAQALNSLANTIYFESGDYEAADSLFDESLAISQQAGDKFGIAKVLINQGASALEAGDYERAQHLIRKSLVYYEEIEYQYGISSAFNYLGQIAADMGEYQSARELIEQSLALHRESGNRRAIVGSLKQLAAIARDTADFPLAKSRYVEALRLTGEMRAERLTLELLTAVAHLAHYEGDNQRALKTAAFILTQPNMDQELASESNALLAQASTALSPEDMTASRQEGEAMTMSGLIQQLKNEVLSGS